jgi:hypothetical protein
MFETFRSFPNTQRCGGDCSSQNRPFPIKRPSNDFMIGHFLRDSPSLDDFLPFFATPDPGPTARVGWQLPPLHSNTKTPNLCPDLRSGRRPRASYCTVLWTLNPPLDVVCLTGQLGKEKKKDRVVAALSRSQGQQCRSK